LSRLLPLLRRAAVLPVPGTGGCLHQPVHVGDVADAVLAALERPAAIGSLYNVAGPEPLPFAELLRTCARTVGSRTRLVSVPLAPLVTLARGYEVLSRHPRIRPEQLRRLAEDKAFPIDAAIRDLGYAPRSFSSGIGDEARLLGLAV
jgi:nucleoside-diphosphate-sugar epimerase